MRGVKNGHCWAEKGKIREPQRKQIDQTNGSETQENTAGDVLPARAGGGI